MPFKNCTEPSRQAQVKQRFKCCSYRGNRLKWFERERAVYPKQQAHGRGEIAPLDGTDVNTIGNIWKLILKQSKLHMRNRKSHIIIEETPNDVTRCWFLAAFPPCCSAGMHRQWHEWENLQGETSPSRTNQAKVERKKKKKKIKPEL